MFLPQGSLGRLVNPGVQPMGQPMGKDMRQVNPGPGMMPQQMPGGLARLAGGIHRSFDGTEGSRFQQRRQQMVANGQHPALQRVFQSVYQ